LRLSFVLKFLIFVPNSSYFSRTSNQFFILNQKHFDPDQIMLKSSLARVLLIGLLSLSVIAKGQHQELDSLKQVLTTLSMDDEQYVQTLWKVMNATIQTDNPLSAAYAREAYLLAEEKFPKLLTKATVNFADRLVYVEQLDSADVLLDAYFRSFQSLDQSAIDSSLLSKYYLTKGAIASRRARLKEAGEYYTRAIDLANQNGDAKTAGTALLRIGSMYHREGDFNTALDHYLQAINYFRKIKSESGLSSTYGNISSVYAYLGENNLSDLYLDSALVIEERQDKVDALIVSYGNVVINAVEKRNDLARAQLFMEKLKKVSVRSTTLRLKGYTFNVVSVFHKGKGDYQASYAAALDAYKIGKENKIKFVLSIAYQNLVHAAQGMKNFERAFLYQREWDAFKDSLNQVDQEKALLELKTKFESEKKEAENKQLMLVNQQQTTLNKLLGGGGILLLLMLGSLFYFYMGKQRANKNLQIHKQQIEVNLQEKEALLREIHHRVKNNLQVISSLLNMQSQFLDDPRMINAVAEGQSRVKAMALIHQKLYQTEHLTEIDFQEYAEQLLTQLAAAFGERTKIIHSKITSDSIKLDIDTAIPLGLIMNELITNVYKYAFAEMDEGDLMVNFTLDNEQTYHLQVADSGKGLPDGFSESKLNSLGLKLVRMLVDQLDGTLEFMNNPGAHFYIRFKKSGLVS
jgi:two-component system, sensor histidine kinase PdtaS